THAAVVDLGVQSIRSMMGGAHRANDLARRSPTLLTNPRQELRHLFPKFHPRLLSRAPVALDSEPVHRVTGNEALLAHDWQIVFRIAGRGTGVAASTGIEI